MTDFGFKYLIQRLDMVFKINQDLKLNDQVLAMYIDFSHNNLTDSSVKVFAESLRKYQSYREVIMRSLSLHKCKDSIWHELANALNKNQ